MMIVTDSNNIVFSEGIIEIYKDKYRYGTYCLKATVYGGGTRNLLTNLSRKDADLAEKAIVEAFAQGKPVMNFSKDLQEALSNEG
ncbi:MAG: hypothetical protein IKG67_03785 [Parasporobacterium sp.]|nr:hypothetical protein [Parasporobacterium sp.]